MALLCNDVEIRGKNKQIWCIHTDAPCIFVRYCAVSMKYYQTDRAKECKVRKRLCKKTEN